MTNEPSPRDPLRFLRHPVASLFSYYSSYHESEPWRLQYVGWIGAFGYVTFYFLRFLRGPQPNLTDDLLFRVIAVVLLLGLAFRDRWPKRAARFYLPYSYFVMMFSLPYAFTYSGLVRGGGTIAISNSFIVVAFLVLLVDWRNTIATIVIGATLAWATYALKTPVPQVPRDMLLQIPALALIIAAAGLTESRIRTARTQNEARIGTLRDSVGFLAHELNTPLATVRGYVDAVRSMYTGTPQPHEVRFEERKPGELLKALDAIEHGAQYCQSLVSTIAKSARNLSPDAQGGELQASKLVRDMLDAYPFEGEQRSCVRVDVRQDFVVPGRRDLLYLVLCTIMQNALHALRDRPSPAIRIDIGRGAPQDGHAPWSIRFQDNGPGIAPGVLALLTRQSISTRKDGTGMGLLFARRVMLTLGGDIVIESDGTTGTTVTLLFEIASEGSADMDSSRF